MVRYVVLTAVFTAFLAGCPETKKQEEHKYSLTQNGCATGEHSFDSTAGMCAGLKNDDLNHGCATGLRADMFQSNGCPGDFFAKVDGAVPMSNGDLYTQLSAGQYASDQVQSPELISTILTKLGFAAQEVASVEISFTYVNTGQVNLQVAKKLDPTDLSSTDTSKFISATFDGMISGQEIRAGRALSINGGASETGKGAPIGLAVEITAGTLFDGEEFFADLKIDGKTLAQGVRFKK